MEWLNYNHLFYFWQAVRAGGVAKAARKLHVAHPTVSTQVRALETRLGEKLFTRAGRGLALTEMGHVVFRYADEIFALGTELLDTVKGRPTGRPARLVIGIADALSKSISRRLLEPALRMHDQVHLVCREDRPERLLADLARHALDLVLSDAPASPSSGVRAFNHLLGESGVSFFAARKLASTLRRNFPGSLHGAPMLLPTDNTTMRRGLDPWFEQHGVRPRVVAEIEDSALLKVFGQDGLGVFPGPTVLERDIRRQYEVELVGHVSDVRERFYAISIERKLVHPAVVAIREAARRDLFA